MPLSGSLQSDWYRGIDWIKSTINKNGGVAQRKLEVVWFDSQNGDIESIAEQIATDTSIVAAIGPFTSANAFKAAPYFIKNKKIMFTTASSSELTRAYAGKDYVWRMVESDISQCKNLILMAQDKKVNSIALLSGDDQYGMSFFNWFGFFASEMGITVTAIEKFNASTQDITASMNSVLFTKPELVVCVPSNVNQAIEMTRCWKSSNNSCQLLFSDLAYMPEFLTGLKDEAEGLEGTVMIPDPEHGFEIEYEIKYGKKPTLGVAQMYDALMVIAFGLELSQGTGGEALMEAIKCVVDGRDGKAFWDDDGVRTTLEKLKRGVTPDILGASGSLNYDDEFYLDVISSTYAHWQVNQNDFLTLNYYSDDGSGRHSATSACWRTYAKELEKLNMGDDISLLPKNNLQALLICSSKGWSNYRHQADVLAYYHMLKKNGLSDDNIILIMEDDLADNSRNPQPGVIRNGIGVDNLRENVEIDYYLNEIAPDDIFNILLGKKSEQTPIVINSTNQTNILFYFVDHGSPKGLLIEGENDNSYYVTPKLFKSKLQELADSVQFRQLLIVIEACYSGIMGAEVDFNAPIMCITSANSYESSKAINYSNTLNTWLSNNFSYHLFNELVDNPQVTLSDLYINLNRTVNGSHVSMYNEEHFGNISLINLNQFFTP